MRIFFTGGGTLGSVTPLLAVGEALQKICPEPREFFWVGTRSGQEERFVREVGWRFYGIVAPKWRRYWDRRNFYAPGLLVWAVLQALILLRRLPPAGVVTAGGFVGVPVVWASWLLGIPVLLHNQDVRWSLSNRLVAPLVCAITAALPDTVPKRWRNKTILTGNPVRSFILRGSLERGLKRCAFQKSIPTLLVIGGGTGAKRLNELVAEALPELTKKLQVVHLTGLNKNAKCKMQNVKLDRYCVREFVTREIADFYCAADCVLTRAGMGVLTELVALQKPMLIVPLPDSPQEDNARYFAQHSAAVVLSQKTLTGSSLASAIFALFNNPEEQRQLAKRAQALVQDDAAVRVAERVLKLDKF